MTAGFANVATAPYSADPTGVADATAGLQAAINAENLPLAPPGTFKHTGLTGRAGLSLIGAGSKATILANSGSGSSFAYSVAIGHVEASISDLTLTKSGAGTPTYGIYIPTGFGLNVERVEIKNHTHGIYCSGGEQCTWDNVWVNTCSVAGVYLTGTTPGIVCANYHKFTNCIFQGNPYGVWIVNASNNCAFANCAFYSNTSAALYVPAGASGVVTTYFENCWFELNTKTLDLRGGSGFVFEFCQFSDSRPVIEAANFNHPGLVLKNCSDGGNPSAYLAVAGIDYKLENPNPGYLKRQCQVAGAYEPVAKAPTRGAGEKATSLPVDMSTWNTAAATGGQTDELGGTAAARISAGGQAIHELANVNGGAALGGVFVTFQIRAKSAGGRLTLQFVGDPTTSLVVSKTISLPNNDWRFLWFTYQFPAGLTDIHLYVYAKADAQDVYCFRPLVSVSKGPIPEIPAGRDMAGLGEYEVFGPNQNVRVFVNNAAPSSGTYAVGDEAVNHTPGAGGTDRWRCTNAAGSGTWKAVALAA